MATTPERWRPITYRLELQCSTRSGSFRPSLCVPRLSSHRTQKNLDAMFHNPIIPGFAPDPSVILVDGIYYLATSSFHLFPGIPIYASTNLQDWKHIGSFARAHCTGMGDG
jgi:hypothetical protein